MIKKKGIKQEAEKAGHVKKAGMAVGDEWDRDVESCDWGGSVKSGFILRFWVTQASEVD